MSSTAKTIAAGNVRIGMDGSGLYEGAKKVKAEFAQIRAVIRQTEPASASYAKKVELLNKAFKDGLVPTSEMKGRLASLRQEFERTKRSSDSAFDASKLAKYTAGIVSAAAAYKQLADSVKLAAGQERMTSIFSAVSGSPAIGRQMINDLKDLQAKGIAFSASSQVAQTMQSFGMASEEVVPIVERLAMVTGGSSDRLQMLGLAFAQAAASGHLMGQDLLQMNNAGWNPLVGMAKRTGLSMVELKKAMEEGRVSIELVKMALFAATSEGGEFNTVLQEQKATLAGQYDSLLTDLEKMKTAIGKDIIPLMKDLVSITREFTDMGDDSNRVGVDKSFMSRLTFGLRWMVAGVKEKTFGDGRNMADLLGGEARRITEEYEQFELARLARIKEKKGETQKGPIDNRMLELLNRNNMVEAPLKETELAKERARIEEEVLKLKERQMEAGRRIIEAQRSPLQVMRDELRELVQLYDVAAIDAMTLERAGLEAVSKYQDASRPREEESSAQSFEYGSREALNQMFGSRADKQLEKLEQQRVLQAQMVEIAKESGKKLDNLAIKAYR